MGNDKNDTKLLLTGTELELMQIIWEAGEASVRTVLSRLPGDRQLAYTSVSTIVRILEKKGVLSSRKEGKTHIYIPNMDKATYEARSIDHLVTSVFNGAPTSLARALLDSDNLTAGDLSEIKKLISERFDK